MTGWLERERMLIGTEGVERLAEARVCVLGAGGVGSAAIEALARAGVGHLMVVDHDSFEDTNRNRQLLATTRTIGRQKAAVAAERVLEINPEAEVIASPVFYLPETRDEVFSFHPDFVLDAIDTVTAKLDLAEQCAARDIPLLCCLGTGNRLDPSLLQIGDISETAGCGCGLARVMRRELRKRGIDQQQVVFSTEPAIATGERTPGSISFVPPVAGFLMAGEAIRRLIGRA